MKNILIYQDYVGHCNNAHVLVAFKHAIPDATISFCDSDDILNGCLTHEISILVMPGGADSYYCERLNGAGNRAIKEYVCLGGTYFGICAGAYYGCEEINWVKGKIAGKRELGFYEGCATGPIDQFIEDRDINKSWDQAIELTLDSGDKSIALYRAGPYFSEPKDDRTTVLARYKDVTDTPPSILSCKVGKGVAILSAVHAEISPNMYKKMIYKNSNPSYQWQSSVCKRYEEGYNPHDGLLDYILKHEGIHG
jgi:glutamine amidotransferase-like uncharacterized protein